MEILAMYALLWAAFTVMPIAIIGMLAGIAYEVVKAKKAKGEVGKVDIASVYKEWKSTLGTLFIIYGSLVAIAYFNMLTIPLILVTGASADVIFNKWVMKAKDQIVKKEV